jgi:IclR family transcriptional regulator, KDG regulon repressor
MPKIARAPEGEGIQAVVVALRVLETLARSTSGVGVAQLATELGSPKMRIYRYLRTLVEQRYARQDPATELYWPGPALHALGLVKPQVFLELARGLMRELESKFGHTTVLGLLEGMSIRIVESVVGSSELAIVSRPGSLLELHYTAMGKAALAFSEAEVVDQVVRMGLKRVTARTITHPEQFRAELQRIKQRGWAQNADEGHIGFNAVAAPVLDMECRLVAVLGMIGSTRMIPERPPRELVAAVCKAASEISARLGHDAT